MEYEDLIAEHQALQKQLADQPDTVEVKRVLNLVAQASDAGERIADPQQREVLRTILKHWGAFAYDRMGEYPATQLAPHKPRGERKRAQAWLKRHSTEAALVAIVFISLVNIAVIWFLFESKPATPTPKPSVLCNGDFENDFECWQHGGELDQSVECDGDECYAVLGNPDYFCLGGVPVGEAWIKQEFKVPEGISSTLSLRYRVFSYDLDLPGFDYFQVAINGERLPERYGNYEWNEPSCDRPPWDSGWRTLIIDLSVYAGKEVEVSFHNVNGTQPFYNTWTHLDDVRIGTRVDTVSMGKVR
jgi:hypothetical protein